MSFALAPSNRLVLHFADENGKTATMDFYVPNTVTDPTATGPATISSTAQALSDSALYETELMIIAEDPTPGTPDSGPYDRPADKAALRFGTADGSFINLQIGGPYATIFSNAWDVDPSNALITALTTALVDNGVNQEGAAIVAFDQGHRRRPPRRKGQ